MNLGGYDVFTSASIGIALGRIQLLADVFDEILQVLGNVYIVRTKHCAKFQFWHAGE